MSATIQSESLREHIRDALHRTRRKTLWLLDQVPEAFLKVRVHSFYSPIGWHFGHVGRTEEYWICHKALGKPVIDDHLSFLFADLPENPKDNRVNLPTREQILEYLEITRSRTLQALENAHFDDHDAFMREGYAFDFAIQHECQHQETICEMLQLISKSASPSLARSGGEGVGGGVCETAPTLNTQHSTLRPLEDTRHNTQDIPSPEYIQIPAGTFTMGTNATCVYDNEREAHEVEIKPFKLAKTQVTASQWLAFIQEKGYYRPELWSKEGWAWRCTEDATHPEYWLPVDNGYVYIGAHGPREIHPEEPAGSISWYEAEAFLKWCGKRFPTEEEWEYAAAYDPQTKQSRIYPWGDELPNKATAVFGIDHWQQQPVGSKSCGASAFGILDMAGNLWEWTSSKFLPYAGFSAFPYDGYSKDHMKGEHLVCRGGSWATAAPILRCTFRNWYVPTYRQGFLGLRCADD